VQDRRAQCLIVELSDIVKPGEDRRDRYRVSDIRITAAAELALMTAGRDIAGSFDEISISARPHFQDDFTEFRDEAFPGSARERRRTIHSDLSHALAKPPRTAGTPSYRLAAPAELSPAAHSGYFIYSRTLGSHG
jgi:hypothetical protein